MQQLPFVIAAYAVTAAGLGGFTIWSILRLRRAEKALQDER